MKQSREVIDEVRHATNLLEVVQEYSQVKLKKHGQNWLGLCPFHNERTPSFNVNPDRGYFKCFGCGKSGDAFAFIMELNGLTFGEALRALAKRANIQLPFRNDAKSEQIRKQRDPLYNALRFAADFFELQLEQSARAQEFLNAREFSADTKERFRLGYAPDEWQGLIDAATAQHIQTETLLAAGLIKKHERGHHYDVFRNRVMFPIWSSSNQIVGFGGRRLSADPNTPKYINSPETDVYHKSVVLYGLEKSRAAIRDNGEAILVEGYTDVLALHQAGVENALAGCGTALTESQVKILSRYTKTLVLLYDADQAGIAAAERAVSLVLQNGLTPYVVSLPSGADPDSYVRDHGADEFRQFIASRRIDFVGFLHNLARINGLLNSPEGRSESIKNVLDKVSLIRDPVLRDEYLKLVSDRYHVSTDQLSRWNRRAPEISVRQPENKAPTPDLQLLDVMLQHGAPIIQYVFRFIGLEDFSNGAPRRLAANLRDLMEEHGNALKAPVSAKQLDADPDLQNLAAEIAFPRHRLSHNWESQDIEVPTMNEDPLKIAQDNLTAIKKHMIAAEINRAHEEFQNAPQDSPERQELMESIMGWIEMRKQIEDGTWFGHQEASADKAALAQ